MAALLYDQESRERKGEFSTEYPMISRSKW